MATDPWAAFNPQAAPATGTFGSRPIISQPAPHPTPQTPEQRASTIASTESTRQSMANQTFDNVTNLRKQFEALQPVQDFRTILPLEASAYKAGPNKAGDLDLIYAFGKIMDPNSVVREGEQVMATNVGGVSEKVKGYLDSLQGQGQLTPQQRKELVGEIRQRTHNVNLAYNQLRNQYAGIAEKYGFDPKEIIGEHPAQPFLQGEADYIQRTYPDQAKAQTIPMGAGEFGGRKDIPALNPQQQAAYDAFTAAHPNASADQIKSFFSAIGFDVQNADAVAKAAQEGVGFAPASSAILKPDISDVRGGNNTGTQDAINATVRGVPDVISMGALDKGIALGDTVFKGGTFDQNLARQYAISDFDQQNHPIARLGGQVLGGALLPFGEVRSIPQAAAVAGGYGAAYGAGSSRSLADVPMNALLGGAAGAAIPVAIAGGGKVANALSAPLRRGADVAPPLVDPQTGELNQVMDAMRPADRVAAMRDMGIQTITPGMAGGRTARVLEQGFNNLPASAGHMEDINSAASGELRRAMQATAQRFGSSKTLNEGGSELQRGANQYIDRARQLTAKAYDAIPISPDARASTSATEATLEGLTQKFGSNPELAAQMNSPQIQKMLDAIRVNGLSWQDLKALRTSIGERIGERRFSDDTATSDLRAVYGALSEDMQNTAAAMGPRAQRAFNRANDLYRNTQQVIDKSLVAILGNDAAKSPEKAAAAVQAMTKGGKSTGDLKTLAQIRAATIKSGAWDEIASTLIHLGGQPANSEGRAFQPQTFVQWYADMSEPARAMLFKPELRKSLDQFVAANQQFARLKGLNNTSQTAPVMFGGGALLTGAGALLNPILGLKMAGVLGLNHVMGRVWTSPQFLRLATGYTKAAAAGNANAVKSQIGRLQKLATTNPELREGIEAVLKSIANDNAVSQVAASPDAQGNQQQ